MKERDTLYPRICQINDSTNLVELAYDPIDKEMMATFKDSIKYVYRNISPSVYGDIVSAESVGKTFNVYLHKYNLNGIKIEKRS
jgi:hypothetical protein